MTSRRGRAVHGLLRETIAFVVRRSGLAFLVRNTFARKSVAVILYHDPSPETLGRHLAYLRRRYTFITLDELVLALRTCDWSPIPPKSVIVTIDDGLRGNFGLLELFATFGVTPTVYVCTGIVGTTRHYWFYEEGVDVETLTRWPNDERLRYLKERRQFTPEREYPVEQRQALSRAEIEAMNRYVDFESHSVSHPVLTTCSDEECEREITASKHEVEALTGRECKHFSYPNGDYGAREIELLKKAGYHSARTVDVGWNGPQTDPLRLKLLTSECDGLSVDYFAAQMAGILPLKAVLKRVRATHARRPRATPLVLMLLLVVLTSGAGGHEQPAGPSASKSPFSLQREPDVAGAAEARRPKLPGRLYSDKSPFNRRISAIAAVDPSSDAMVQQLVAEVNEKGWPIATKAFTVPLFYATAKTRRYDVRITHPTQRDRYWLRVPIPDGAAASPDSDGAMTVIDRTTSCEYDFGRPERSADGSWTAYWLNALYTTSDGVYDYDMAVRASGFASAAGLITPREMKAGYIDHALVFTMANGRVGGPVRPATQSDGRSSLPGAIPQGARVQLDPKLDLDSLGLPRWQKVIARALQEYGMYLADTGGAVALFAQHPLSTRGYVYPWGDVTYGYMSPALVKYLRVLRVGSQFEPSYKFVPTRCTTLR